MKRQDEETANFKKSLMDLIKANNENTPVRKSGKKKGKSQKNVNMNMPRVEAASGEKSADTGTHRFKDNSKNQGNIKVRTKLYHQG